MLQKRYFEDHVKNWIKVGEVWQIKGEGEEKEKKEQNKLSGMTVPVGTNHKLQGLPGEVFL